MDGTTTRKFSRREFAALLLGAVVTGSSGHAVAAVNPAEGYVGKIADEVMSLANSGAKGTALRGRFASVLNRYINLRNIANFALGPYQKKLPPGDKNEFYTLFNNYAAALFVYYVDDFKGSDLKIISTSQAGQFHHDHKCDCPERRRARAGEMAAYPGGRRLQDQRHQYQGRVADDCNEEAF